MHLMYILNEDGKRIYTLKKALQGRTTSSAHPARFSPDDKFANERLRLQTRFAAKLEASKTKHLDDIACVKKMKAEIKAKSENAPRIKQEQEEEEEEEDSESE
ncbi:hypothetical protein P8C59_008348 [Phyllachora maydis]|uniref:H/ACA ribonucleoprotein complex subunit NOP10 n=1 Tax=Phyllachora maydis TaxID=1825666 RepID=A0AAD9MF38_9PEZI|nr:hypothetical protein P8C59_008348 [Phyllachora maydis]